MPAYRSPFGPDSPPGPYVDVILRWGNRERALLALLDTGADQTLIPDLSAQGLGLRHIDDVPVLDANGTLMSRPVYAGDLEFNGFDFRALPVIGSDLPIALIGRDVLNEFVAVLDGPTTTFRIDRTTSTPTTG